MIFTSIFYIHINEHYFLDLTRAQILLLNSINEKNGSIGSKSAHPPNANLCSEIFGPKFFVHEICLCCRMHCMYTSIANLAFLKLGMCDFFNTSSEQILFYALFPLVFYPKSFKSNLKNSMICRRHS